jgi:hypothetical protein
MNESSESQDKVGIFISAPACIKNLWLTTLPPPFSPSLIKLSGSEIRLSLRPLQVCTHCRLSWWFGVVALWQLHLMRYLHEGLIVELRLFGLSEFRPPTLSHLQFIRKKKKGLGGLLEIYTRNCYTCASSIHFSPLYPVLYTWLNCNVRATPGL